MAAVGTTVTGESVAGPPLALCVVATPEGDVLVAGTVDGRLVVHDLANEQVQAAWDASDDRVVAVVGAVRDGKQVVVSLSELGMLEMWTLDGEPVDTFSVPGIAGTAVAAAGIWVGGDWPMIAWIEGDEVRVIRDGDIRTVEARRRAASPTAVGFDGAESLAVGFSDGRVALHPLADADTDVVELDARWPTPVRAVAVQQLPDLRRVFAGSERGSIAAWPSIEEAGDGVDGEHRDWIRALVFTRLGDEDVIVSASDDGTIKIWRGLFVLVSIERHTASIRCLHVTSDSAGSQVVVSGGTDGSLRFWDVGAGTQSRLIEQAHDGWLEALTSTDDGAIWSAGRDSRVRIWMPDGTVQVLSVDGRPRAMARFGDGADGGVAW